MRITLRAHGRLGRGPEREMTDDYLRRASQLARGTGFRDVVEDEVETKGKVDRTVQTRALLDGVPDGATVVLMDERGKSLTSAAIARQLLIWRDDGVGELYILIGPADGYDPTLLPASATRWAFGTQTWPHKLLRVMLAEQLFRALSILAGTPYHRP